MVAIIAKYRTPSSKPFCPKAKRQTDIPTFPELVKVRGGAKIFHGSLINVSTMMLTIRVISIVELAAKNIVLRFSCEIFKLARVLKIKQGAPIKATISVICAVFTPPREMRQK